VGGVDSVGGFELAGGGKSNKSKLGATGVCNGSSLNVGGSSSIDSKFNSSPVALSAPAPAS
jgi:hypothetical protein